MRQCQKCTARPEALEPVPWQINNPESPVLFIGRNPGRVEDEEGVPFIGPGGKQLDEFLRIAGVDRGKVNVGNLINCYTTDDREPELPEIAACAVYLLEYLTIIQPKIVVLFGALTLKSLTGLSGMTKHEGKLYPHRMGFTVFPCVHPGAALYQRNKYWPVLVKEATLLRGILVEDDALRVVLVERESLKRGDGEREGKG